MTNLTLFGLFACKKKNYQGRVADAWLKGGEVTILSSSLKRRKSHAPQIMSLFWRPQSLLWLFSVSVKKPHTSRNILDFQEMLESSAYLMQNCGSQHCSSDVFLLSYRKYVSNFSSTWRCRFVLINALTTNSPFPTEAIFSSLCS